MAQDRTPSVGRRVHWVAGGELGGYSPIRCQHAVITEVCRVATDVDGGDELAPNVGLVVFSPTGMNFVRHVEHDAGAILARSGDSHLCTGRPHSVGTWHWPDGR